MCSYSFICLKLEVVRQNYVVFTQADLEGATRESVQAQQRIEEADNKPFDVFLNEYFTR